MKGGSDKAISVESRGWWCGCRFSQTIAASGQRCCLLRVGVEGSVGKNMSTPWCPIWPNMAILSCYGRRSAAPAELRHRTNDELCSGAEYDLSYTSQKHLASAYPGAALADRIPSSLAAW